MDKNDEKDQMQHEKVILLINEKQTKLGFDEEDKKLIQKLWKAYYKKRRGISRSGPEALAAGVLWQYSRMNSLWEAKKEWTREKLAGMFNVRAKTISDKSADIARTLKIKLWDGRFCREDVSDGNPLKELVMAAEGFITSKKEAIEKGMFFTPLQKTKEDYYSDGCDFLDEGYTEKAIRCFKKALEFDDEYVDAHNGLGSAYMDNLEVSKKYYQKAYELTKKHFNNKWPKAIEWGVTEQRQYLRAIFGLALILWRENKVEEAKELFMLSLKLNNSDNLGARYVLAAIYEGLSYEEFGEIEDKCIESANYDKIEELLKKQNKLHKFYEYKA